MKDLFIVTKFTMKDMVKRKSFIISTIIILVLIVIGFNIPKLIKTISGESVKEKVLIVDESNIFGGALDTIQQVDFGYDVQIGQATFEEIKEKINNGDINSAIIVEKKENNINARYIVENISIISGVPEDIINYINTLYTNIQISKLGLTEAQMMSITPNFEFTMEQTSEEEAHGNVFVMMLMSLVLFYAIYFCAYQVSSSITTEKTSKIMETLVTSTSPRTIVLRKNNRNRNSWINPNDSNSNNSINKCQNIFRFRNIRSSFRYV